MKRTYKCCKADNRPVQRAALGRRLFLFAGDTERINRFKNRKRKEQSDHTRPDELPGKGSGCFSSAGKVGPCGFWEKSSSPVAPVFFPKTLPAGSIRFYRPIVQRDM